MSAFPKSTWRGKVFGSRQNSLAIPLITVRSRIAAWCRQGRSSMRRRASLDGWPRCNTMHLEGNGKCDAILE
jgi:hypothetical protein